MNKYIIWTAKAVSNIFAPWYLALLGYALLLIFSYMNAIPWSVMAILLLTVYFFTILLPHWAICLYVRIQGWKEQEIGKREHRVVPYLISIMCYMALLYVLNNVFHAQTYSQAIIVGALLVQVACAIANIWIKVSTHAAGAAGITGALIALSLVYGFNPSGWLAGSVMMCGVVCSARMILRQHTLGEVGLGSLIGLLCGWSIVLFL